MEDNEEDKEDTVGILLDTVSEEVMMMVVEAAGVGVGGRGREDPIVLDIEEGSSAPSFSNPS